MKNKMPYEIPGKIENEVEKFVENICKLDPGRIKIVCIVAHNDGDGYYNLGSNSNTSDENTVSILDEIRQYYAKPKSPK